MVREIYPTKHLIKYMRERHVTWGEIVDIVDHPEVVTSPDMQGRQLYQNSSGRTKTQRSATRKNNKPCNRTH